MTSFKDVIRPLTEQLEILRAKTASAASRYQADTTQFQTYVTSNIAGVSGNISFLGKGADACTAAVGRNVSRAQHVITKLQDFQLACDQTNKELEEMSTPFDNESSYHLGAHDLYGSIDFENADRYMTFIPQYFRDAQGYSPYDTTDLNTIIIWRIREDTLPGLSFQLNDLLTPGKGQGIMEDNIGYAVSCIQSDFQKYQSQRHSELQSYLAAKDISHEQYQYYDPVVDSTYELAMHYVNVIADKMKNGYTEWVTEFQALVGQFQIDVIAASEINQPGVGDLIADVTAPGMTGKVYLWQTTNGLVVVVKGGTTSAEVEGAIQQYLKAHGLDKTNTAITLLGYQNGGSVAQQMVLDEGDKNYHVTNLVLVGSQLQDNLPAHLNSFVYNAPTKASTESETTYLGLKPDQIIIPIAAVALTPFTDGLSDLALGGMGVELAEGSTAATLTNGGVDVTKELILAGAWNQAVKLGIEHPQEVQSAASPFAIYLDLGDGNGIHLIRTDEVTRLANGQLPKTAKIYVRQSSVVPAEAGANLTNFTDSSYLNAQSVPDPGSDKLLHGGALPLGN